MSEKTFTQKVKSFVKENRVRIAVGIGAAAVACALYAAAKKKQEDTYMIEGTDEVDSDTIEIATEE